MAIKSYLTSQDILGRTIKVEIEQVWFDQPQPAMGGKIKLAPNGLPLGFRVTKKRYGQPGFDVSTKEPFDKVTLSIESRASIGIKQWMQFYDFFDVNVTQVNMLGDDLMTIAFFANNASYFEASVDSLSFY